MKKSRISVLTTFTLTLALALLACSQGEGQGSEVCTGVMTFIEDVNVPEGTPFAPGEAFTKTWRIRNDGDCDWSGYQITFADGEPMGTASQAIPDTPAGGEIDISIEMTAPGGEGGYIGRWQIESPDGVILGHLTCSILVVGSEDAATEVETEDEPPPEDDEGSNSGSASNDLPPLDITNVTVSNSTPASGESVSISFFITNTGDAIAENFDIIVIPNYSPGGPNNPLDPSRIEQLGPGMSADFAWTLFWNDGEHTVRVLASYDWYEDGDAEPGPGEDAEDVIVTVSE